MYRLMLVTLGLWLLFIEPVWAMMPVYDPAVVARLISEAQQLQQQISMIRDVKRISQNGFRNMVDKMTGNFGYGKLFTDVQSIKDNQLLANQWQDALRGLSAGNPDRYQTLLKLYQKSGLNMSDKDFLKGGAHDRLTGFHRRVRNHRAVSLASEYAYNNLSTASNHLFELVKKVDTTPSLKASMDLNSRLVGELGTLQLRVLRASILSNQLASSTAADKIEGEEATNQFLSNGAKRSVPDVSVWN